MKNTQVTMFNFREVIVSLLSNMDVMNHSNLLFYDNYPPTKCHPSGCPIGEVITSNIFLQANQHLCKNENDVLWPI